MEEEVYTPLVLEPKKARILPCTVELFSVRVPDVPATITTSSVYNSAASVESTDSDSSTSWLEVVMEEIPDGLLLLLLLRILLLLILLLPCRTQYLQKI